MSKVIAVRCRDGQDRVRALVGQRLSVEVHDASGHSFAGDWSRRVMGFVAAAAVVAAISAAPQASAKARHDATAVPDPQVAAAVTTSLPPIPVKVGAATGYAIHPMERVRLCMEAAKRLQLDRVGRTWQDVYGVIHAETGWLARDGMGRNGRVSQGLGQLEGPTAKSLGVSDPNDPREAVVAVAALVKEGAAWARSRGVVLKDAAISVYYNLSTQRRQAWSGSNIAELPFETQRHIANVSDGKRQAQILGKQYAAFIPTALQQYQARQAQEAAERERAAQQARAQAGSMADKQARLAAAKAALEQNAPSNLARQVARRAQESVSDAVSEISRNGYVAALKERVRAYLAEETPSRDMRERQSG